MKICIVHAGRRDSYFLCEVFSDYEVHLITDYYNKNNITSKILSLFGFDVNLRLSNNEKLNVHYNMYLLVLQFLEIFLKRNSNIYKIRSKLLAKLFIKKYKQHKFDIAIFYYNSGAAYTFVNENLQCEKVLFQMHPHPKFTIDQYKNYLLYNDKYPFNKIRTEEEEFHKDESYIKELNDELYMADKVIVTSTITEKSISNLISKRNIIKILYPRKEKVSKIINYNIKGKINLCYVGQFIVRKGIYELLDFIKNSNDYHLTIYTRDKINIEHPNITIKKNQPSEIIWNEIQSNGHYLILNSLLEGFGLVLIEALEKGIPLLSTKNSIAEDLIVNGSVNGFIYKDLDFLNDHLSDIKNANLQIKYDVNFTEYKKKLIDRLI